MGGELFLWREGFGPDGPQSPAKGESLRKFVSGMGGVGC